MERFAIGIDPGTRTGLAFVVAFFLAVAALLLLANRYRPADRDSSPVERREPVSTTAIY